MPDVDTGFLSFHKDYVGSVIHLADSNVEGEYVISLEPPAQGYIVYISPEAAPK